MSKRAWHSSLPAALALSVAVFAVVLVFAWERDGSADAAVLVIPVLVALGAYTWGKWRAVPLLGAVPWVILALAADLAWATGLWDRSATEYEPLAVTPFVIVLAVPALSVAASIGVAARRIHRSRGR